MDKIFGEEDIKTLSGHFIFITENSYPLWSAVSSVSGLSVSHTGLGFQKRVCKCNVGLWLAALSTNPSRVPPALL